MATAQQLTELGDAVAAALGPATCSRPSRAWAS